ncbi:MAG: Holliday junction resolvase RuvX [Alphaproteobacteria bacterium]
MILQDFKVFPRVGRVLGVDWGMRRIGVAVSDETRQFVFTRPVLNFKSNQNNQADVVAKCAMEEGAVGIVVGLPVYNDGSDSETTVLVREFVKQLTEKIDLPICMLEENLTSVVAQEEMGRVRVRDLKEILDSESARVILENAIAIINRS